MKKYSLNGTWKLKGKLQDSNDDFIELNAKVPGMVQLDLSASGFLPEDLYLGENIRSTEKFEKYEWLYERIFTADGYGACHGYDICACGHGADSSDTGSRCYELCAG